MGARCRLGEWLYTVWAKRHPAPLAPQEDHDPFTCPQCREDLRGLRGPQGAA